MSPKTFVGVAGVIFVIVATLHALRLFLGWGVEIGGFKFPLCISVVAFFLAGYMSYQSLKLYGKM